jgi:hypothetical protein
MSETQLIKLVKDKNVIDILASIIATLERSRLDEEGAQSLFKTKWAKNLFHRCTRDINKEKVVNIDEWFLISLTYETSRNKDQSDFDWIEHLLNLEYTIGSGCLIVLHNCLDLEFKAQQNLAKMTKIHKNYDNFGVPKLGEKKRDDYTWFSEILTRESKQK